MFMDKVVELVQEDKTTIERQQRKLIKAILDRDGRFLAEDDVELTDAEKDRFFRLVSTGVIRRDDFVRMVAGIKTPSETEAFSKIATSNHKRRILAYFTGVGFDNYERVSADTVADFLRKYPDPYKFLAPKKDFLEAIKRSNPISKYEDYVKEMCDFTQDVYGKEQEYARRARELIQLAEDWQVDQDAVRLSGEYLKGAIIEGDAWIQDGKAYTLTTELLEQGGLTPRYELEISGVQIALSRAFMVDVHEAVVGYVKFNDVVYVRGYYRSNSQGMWRYLADYVGGNGEIAWYGVGFNEESLTLPMKLQKQLNAVCKRGLHEVTGVNMGFFLGGTARRFESKEEYHRLVDAGEMKGAYYAEVMREPMLNFGTLSASKLPPESIDIDGNEAPNFRNQLDHYDMKTEMYGNVAVRQFPSMDDKLRYMMIERGFSAYKKAWVGAIEVNSPITSTGLKREWVSSGDILTPLYEYHTMAGGYGEEITGERSTFGVDAKGVPIAVTLDAEGGKVPDGYLSMWDKYLKLVPMVQKYLYTWREAE